MGPLLQRHLDGIPILRVAMYSSRVFSFTFKLLLTSQRPPYCATTKKTKRVQGPPLGLLARHPKGFTTILVTHHTLHYIKRARGDLLTQQVFFTTLCCNWCSKWFLPPPFTTFWRQVVFTTNASISHCQGAQGSKP